MKAQSTLIGTYDLDSVTVTHPRYKAQGYRIQLYSGAHGRKSRAEAQRVGKLAQTLFPELSVYCRYKEPRWLCRIGDFPTQEAAHHYLQVLRRSALFTECHLVKSQVLLPLHTFTPQEEND